jgi:hypothetical protein
MHLDGTDMRIFDFSLSGKAKQQYDEYNVVLS